MMYRLISVALVAAGCLWSVGCRKEQTLASVEREMAAKWDSYRTVIAEMTVDTEIKTDESTLRSQMVGTWEYMRDGDKTLIHQEGRSRGAEERKGMPVRKIDQRVFTIADGAHVYLMSDAFGNPAIYKAEQGLTQDTMGGSRLFQNLHEKYNLTLLPDEEFEGRPVYVIEAIPKERTSAYEERMVYYLDKETGVAVRAASGTLDGKVSIVMTARKLRFNETIKPERFVFVQPEGVPLHDMTRRPMLIPDDPNEPIVPITDEVMKELAEEAQQQIRQQAAPAPDSATDKDKPKEEKEPTPAEP